MTDGLARLPSPVQLLDRLDASRQASFTLPDGFRNGASFEPLLPNNRTVSFGLSDIYAPAYKTGNALTNLAYAVYSFKLSDYDDSLASLTLKWSDAPAATDLYVGLANFQQARWEWFSGEQLATEDAGTSFLATQMTDYIKPGSDMCLLVVAVTGSSAAILDSIQIYMKQAPVAELIADQTSGKLPLDVSFDASGSSDADGNIVDFEWDFNGNGSFNEAGPEALARGSAVPAAYSFDQLGTFAASVRVTDNDGKSSMAEVPIQVGNSLFPTASLNADVNSGFKPLSVSFDASGSSDPDGSIVDYEWDFDGNGVFNESSNGEDLARGQAQPPAYDYTAVGGFLAMLRVTDDTADTAMATLQITVDNSPPNADLQSDQNQGNAPLTIAFDASGSNDPGGNIVDYEWDFDGDSLFNEPGAEETAHGSAVPDPYVYDLPGNYDATVRVTDDDGASSTATQPIRVHGWSVITIDAPGGLDAGYDISMSLVNGNPALVHVTKGTKTLRYLRSSSADGASAADWTAITIDATNNASRSDLAIINGNPAVSYFRDSAPGGLLYRRSSTAEGTSLLDWSAEVAVDSSGSDRGKYNSLAEIAGNPAIAYTDGGNQDLRYARASTTGGEAAADWSNVLVDGTASAVGDWPSLATVSNNPAIAYISDTDKGVRYARATSNDGMNETDWSGGIYANVATFTAGAMHPSLRVVNGRPAIAFQDLDNFYLNYARSNGQSGSSGSWNTQITVDNVPVTGEYACLEIIGGNPAIAYHDATQMVPRYVRATSGSGTNPTAWNNKVSIPVSGPAGSYAALVDLGNGKAGLAFRSDGAQGTVLYAVFN